MFISEIKQRLGYQIPGFKIIEAGNEKSNRGGLAMLIKLQLYKDIKCIDKSIQEQIWFELNSVPNVVFGGIYITPSESLYFRMSAFAELQGKTRDNNKSYIFGGDLNARCGGHVNDLIPDEWRYSFVDASINCCMFVKTMI